MFRPIRLLMISSLWLPVCAFAAPSDYVYYPLAEYGEREQRRSEPRIHQRRGQYSSAKVHRTLTVKSDGEIAITPLEGLDPEILDGF